MDVNKGSFTIQPASHKKQLFEQVKFSKMDSAKTLRRYDHPESAVTQCACKCSHKKFNSFNLLTMFIAVLSLCLGAYLYVRTEQERHQSCVMSDKDTERLLMKLRSSESKPSSTYENSDVIPEYMDTSEMEMKPLHRMIREAVEGEKKKKKKGKKGKGKKHKRCQCRGKKGKKGPAGPPGPPGPPGLQGERGPEGPTGVATQVNTNRENFWAAHYKPDFWKDRRDLEMNERQLCIYVKKWGGTACRNRTLEMTTGKLNFFHPASWVEENSHIHKPATQLDNGEFQIIEEGLYLLYSSVTFHDLKLKESLAVTVNGKRLFKCMEGVDYVDKTMDRGSNSKYKTCSTSGVTYLQKGDRVAVENLYSNTRVDLSHDATFFGLVQLVPGGKEHQGIGTTYRRA